MTFREALEREIAAQGISVAEVAQKSNVSKGTIYNILNGTTEEARIRAATRRAIARGCDRDIETLPDGSVVFVDPQEDQAVHSSQDIHFEWVPFRPFRGQAHLSEPFDWLHAQEEVGRLVGLKTVDRVFQQREDFLELVVKNMGDLNIVEISFTTHVVFDNGVMANIESVIQGSILPGQSRRYTVFLLAGASYHLTLYDVTYLDENNQSWQVSNVPSYRFKGDLA
jgi:transcriptional regulator with XRE-family HTH domain